MANFIEWQVFENTALIVKDNDFFDKINLFRDEDYNIHYSWMEQKGEKNNG